MLWKWDLWFGVHQPHEQCSRFSLSELGTQVNLYSSHLYLSSSIVMSCIRDQDIWLISSPPLLIADTDLSPLSYRRRRMGAIFPPANYRHEYSPILLNIDCGLSTQHLNRIKTNINHMEENFIKPVMKANRQCPPKQDPICPRPFEY